MTSSRQGGFLVRRTMIINQRRQKWRTRHPVWPNRVSGNSIINLFIRNCRLPSASTSCRIRIGESISRQAIIRDHALWPFDLGRSSCRWGKTFDAMFRESDRYSDDRGPGFHGKTIEQNCVASSFKFAASDNVMIIFVLLKKIINRRKTRRTETRLHSMLINVKWIF